MKQKKLRKKVNKNFLIKINLDNIHRLSYVISVLAFIQFIQAVFYIFSPNSTIYDHQLIAIKLLIIITILIILVSFHFAKRANSFFNKHLEILVTITILILLTLALINTFKAQSITSDISIYILSTFTIAAAMRLRPTILMILFSMNYVALAIGIPLFQESSILITSHIINGLIVNLLAFVIAYMFYNYSLNDYIDKAELKSLSEHDSLTGLLNHGAIHHVLDTILNQKDQDQVLLHVALFDLDYFKSINDTYGHRFGDSILSDVSAFINKIKSDSVICSRYGGDEFMIIFKDKTSEEVNTIFTNLLLNINTICINETPITFSCGIIKYNHETLDQLIEKADQAMYAAKDKGRNQVVFF